MCTAAVYRTKDTYFGRTLLLIFAYELAIANYQSLIERRIPMSDFEAELIHHAAPTLLGRKQSNLFSLPLSLLPKCREEIALYGKKLAEKGICIVYLYSFKNRVFIMVYRQNAMMRYLRVPHVRDYLISLGYPARIGKKDAMTETLAHLRKRMQADGDFPHEIGFFLGYPPADVFAFMREKGQNYKCVGFWKVYGDEKRALRIFQCYRDCRDQMMEQVTAGSSILSLLGAA